MDIEVSPPQQEPVARTPRPFSEIPPLWLGLPHMNEHFFAGELVHASALNTVLGVAVYTLAGAAAVVIVGLLQNVLRQTQYPSAIQTTTLVVGCLTLFITPLTFYLNTGMNYLGALVFGGKGKFNDQAYLASLFVVPIGLVSSAISSSA